MRMLIPILLLAPPLVAQDSMDWSQWRGPARDGISRETAWRADGESRILWSADVGLGYSTVSIAEGRLFTIGHDEKGEQDIVFCLDPRTGEEKWRFSFPAEKMAKYHGGGSLTTPSVDGERLFVSNREGKFFCLDTATGEERWRKDVVEEHGAVVPTWGLAASPLVLDDMIVLNVGVVLAYDRDGELIWKSTDSGHAYSTPAWFEHNGAPRLAVFNGDGLVVLDQKTGVEIARSPWKTKHDVNAATPVVIGDRIFISSGYNKGCSMLAFDGKKLETLWVNRDMRSHMAGCVEYGGHLFGFDEGTVKCMDLDGEVTWTKRGLGKGALLLAGDKLVMLSHRGQLVIADAAPDEYREHSSTDVLEPGGVQWTTPVLVGGLIYCRSSKGQLVCVDRRIDEPTPRKG